MKIDDFGSRVDEWGIPIISSIKDEFHQYQGNKEVKNVAKVLMKEYMHYLGINNTYASRQSIYDFVVHNIEYNDKYHFDSVLLQSYKTGLPKYIKHNQEKEQAAITTPKQKIEPTLKTDTSQVSVEKTNLDKNILDPSYNKQNIRALHNLILKAYKAGGTSKLDMEKYLDELRNNKMLRDKNPNFFKKINGNLNIKESLELIDFASFLVEYDIMQGKALQGAIQFLKEDDVVADDIAGDPVDTNPSDSDYKRYLVAKLPRFAVVYYLEMVAREMINSGLFTYNKNRNKDYDKKNPNSSYYVNNVRDKNIKQKPPLETTPNDHSDTSENISSRLYNKEIETKEVINIINKSIKESNLSHGNRWSLEKLVDSFLEKYKDEPTVSFNDIDHFKDSKGMKLPSFILKNILAHISKENF